MKIKRFKESTKKANKQKAKNILKVAKMELSRIMGFPEYINYDLTSELGQETYSIDIDDALAQAYEVRPELLSAQKTAEAAKMDLRSRKRDFTPNLSVDASYGNALGTYDTYSYGFGVSLNYSNFNIMKTKKIIDKYQDKVRSGIYDELAMMNIVKFEDRLIPDKAGTNTFLYDKNSLGRGFELWFENSDICLSLNLPCSLYSKRIKLSESNVIRYFLPAYTCF